MSSFLQGETYRLKLSDDKVNSDKKIVKELTKKWINY